MSSHGVIWGISIIPSTNQHAKITNSCNLQREDLLLNYLRVTFTQERKKNPLIGTENYLLYIVDLLMQCYFKLSNNQANELLFMLMTSKCLLYFLLKIVKIVHTFQGFLYFVIIRNDKTICWLESDKTRIALLISYFSESF